MLARASRSHSGGVLCTGMSQDTIGRGVDGDEGIRDGRVVSSGTCTLSRYVASYGSVSNKEPNFTFNKASAAESTKPLN